jgi:hypothetical protein
MTRLTSSALIQLDTARFYGGGTSEATLAEVDLVKKGLIVETKLYPNTAYPSEMLQKCELEIPYTEHISPYYLYSWHAQGIACPGGSPHTSGRVSESAENRVRHLLSPRSLIPEDTE